MSLPYPLKFSENHSFPDDLVEYNKGPVTWNGVNYKKFFRKNFVSWFLLGKLWDFLNPLIAFLYLKLNLPQNYNRQIFLAVLFNIRNYSPEVINIQRREAELNIILPRVNNFDIKQKKAWNICFIICHQHQTRSGKIKTNKTQQISVKTQVFFVKTELRHI